MCIVRAHSSLSTISMSNIETRVLRTPPLIHHCEGRGRLVPSEITRHTCLPLGPKLNSHNTSIQSEWTRQNVACPLSRMRRMSERDTFRISCGTQRARMFRWYSSFLERTLKVTEKFVHPPSPHPGDTQLKAPCLSGSQQHGS